jgi:hypothetical protein
MESFIGFVLRFNLNFLYVLMIRDEYRGIVDKCALNRAASLLPRVLFVVELKSYAKHDHFVNVYSDVPLLVQSPQRIRVTRRTDVQGHCPRAYPKLIFPRHI